MIFNEGQNYWASVKKTKDFLAINTSSGLGMISRDYLFPTHLLSPDVDNEIIGQIVLQALSNSRTLSCAEDRADLFDPEKSKERHENWIKMLMKNYNIKTKKALFTGMKSSTIHLINDTINISISKRMRLQAWGGIGKDDIAVSLSSTPEEIGKALKSALSQCIG
jgi:hypothetical protein